jgi:hypothetical protein
VKQTGDLPIPIHLRNAPTINERIRLWWRI